MPASSAPIGFFRAEEVSALPRPTPERPLRVLLSACLVGIPCGVDGTAYGEYPHVLLLSRLPNVQATRFCPEESVFGTPRSMPDIHGGNGFDVLDGKVRVLTDKGDDWTAGFVSAAYEMLRIAQAASIDLAVVQNMSAACGTQVISEGCRFDTPRRFQRGPGVSTALLLRNGFRVVNALDLRTLDLLLQHLDPSHVLDPTLVNYDERAWYQENFGRR